MNECGCVYSCIRGELVLSLSKDSWTVIKKQETVTSNVTVSCNL
jgi:hypothetical protein